MNDKKKLQISEALSKPMNFRGTSGPKYSQSCMFLEYLFGVTVPGHPAVRPSYLPPSFHVPYSIAV